MLPPLLVDANVPTDVVQHLRHIGVDVISAIEQGWGGWSDDELLAEATRQRRFMLTQDKDFGKLAIVEGQPFHGIILLRPGDDVPKVVVRRVSELMALDYDWPPQSIAIYRRGRLRVRQPPRETE